MKKIILKILSGTLAALMLLTCLVACGNGESHDSGLSLGDLGLESRPDMENLDSYELEIRDMGGKAFRIWYTDDGMWRPTPMKVTEDQMATGDIISRAGYRRNLILEEKLNVTLDWTVSHSTHSKEGEGSALSELRAMQAAGDTARYDIIFAGARPCGWLSQEGFFYDMSASKNIHFDRPYYEGTMNEQVKLFGQQFFAAGWYSTSNVAGLSAFFANVGILKSISQDKVTAETLYKAVDEHTFTLEYVMELGKDFATPAENTGDPNTDRVVWHSWPSYTFPIYYDMGGTVLEFNNRQYECTVRDTRNQELLTYLQEKLGNSPLVSFEVSMNPFYEGLSVFHYTTMAHLGDVVSRDLDATLLPSPLYQEGDEYFSYSASYNINYAGIPVDSSDIDKATYLYDTFMAFSYEYVYPAYYENVYGIRYQTSHTTARIFDMIAHARVICPAEVYRLFPGSPIGAIVKNDSNDDDGWLPGVGSGTQKLKEYVEASMSNLGW